MGVLFVPLLVAEGQKEVPAGSSGSAGLKTRPLLGTGSRMTEVMITYITMIIYVYA
jgi:hypothetical protein